MAIVGRLLVLYAAFAFAAANVAAKALYMRGSSLVCVFLVRSCVVYLANGGIELFRHGPTSARNVLLLRVGRRRDSAMAACRGALGALTGVLLNLSFFSLSLGDSFSIFKGVDAVGTAAIGQAILGQGERLTLREGICGVATLFGLLLVMQPPALFGGGSGVSSDGVSPNSISTGAALTAAGCVLSLLGGLCGAGFNVLTRSLSVPEVGMAPAMLLSYFQVAVFCLVGCLGSLADVLSASSSDATSSDATSSRGVWALGGWAWSSLAPPREPADWALLGLHCTGVLSGQLAVAAGMASTRAGVGAILALVEIPFAAALGVGALGEMPSALGALGATIIFASLGAMSAERVRNAAARFDAVECTCTSAAGGAGGAEASDERLDQRLVAQG